MDAAQLTLALRQQHKNFSVLVTSAEQEENFPPVTEKKWEGRNPSYFIVPALQCLFAGLGKWEVKLELLVSNQSTNAA